MLTVTGNTDLVGTAEYNKALGMKRAEIVGKYLEAKGINSDRIIIESKGEDNLLRIISPQKEEQKTEEQKYQ